MAVFPDRIVLKNSTDTQAQIIAAIEEGGTNEIGQGEIVLGLRAGDTGIYAKDETGTIVSLGGGGGSGGGGVTSIIPGGGISIDQPTGDVTITATGTSAGVSAIYAGTGIAISSSTGNVTISATGGGGGGGGDATLNLVEVIFSTTDGKADSTEFGSSGIFAQGAADEDVWITVYPTDEARTADSTRAYGVAPAEFSGVLGEWTFNATDFYELTPTTAYYNGDFPAASKLYFAVRDTSGAPADSAQVFLSAYANVMTESDGGGSGGAVSSVNGKIGAVVLGVDDLIPSVPTDGSLLQFNQASNEWECAGGADSSGGSLYRTYALTENPMLGPTTAYPGLTELLVDGWVEIQGYANTDDGGIKWTAPQSWRDAAQGVRFLSGQTSPYDGGEFFCNTNGGCGWDNFGSQTPGRSGIAINDASTIDLYVCHKSADMKGKLAGYKETVDGDGVRYLHVRQSFLDPYNGAGSWVVETVFSSEGCVIVKYGDSPTTSGSIPDDAVNALDHGIVIKDSFSQTSGKNPVLSGSTLGGFPGLTPAGNYVFETYADPGPAQLKVKVQDLLDVVVTGSSIADGSVLVYDGTAEQWNPSTDSISRGALLSAVAASADFADFKSRIAAL